MKPQSRRSSTEFLSRLGGIWADIFADSSGRSLKLPAGLAAGTAILKKCHAAGHKLMFIGNGGSAAIASHMALDFWRAAGFDAMAFNDASQLTCMANDFGFENVFAEPIRRFARLGDTLLAVSSSGRSANILRGVVAARKKGCAVVTLSGFDADNPLRSAGDLNFYVPSNSYPLVEIAHLGILGAMMEECVPPPAPAARTAALQRAAR